jgi:hypothetical protein
VKKSEVKQLRVRLDGAHIPSPVERSAIGGQEGLAEARPGVHMCMPCIKWKPIYKDEFEQGLEPWDFEDGRPARESGQRLGNQQ